ncbi:MAG: DEAD/DEAH box helicase [Chloroflexi bacterium]|nr:DEAD/DEAH box helicase [Chloroflexota bacterium]
MTSIVALDLETTGLDTANDAIIEIGAVRFNDRRIEDEWTTLVNPGRKISNFITKLTGITNAMVRGAPTIDEVLDELVDFVEDLPVLGHNVGFDLAFLQRYGVLKYNEGLDTYDMASVLIPGAGRYNLGALGQLLGIPLPATHRALDDARVTQGVYTRLFDKALNLPLDLLAEIVRLGEPLDWGAGWVFKQAMKLRSRDAASSRPARVKSRPIAGPLFSTPAPVDVEPLTPAGEPTPLEIEEVAAILEHGGEFSRHFPQFEHRPQQVEMLRIVAESLSEGNHTLVEAGTGTGKSIAYLIPAALWSLQNQTRVVISTNTINLQDQLVNKDIPDVEQALGFNLNATVLKGRRNYLCPRRLEALRRRRPENANEMRVLAKMLLWLEESESGDLSEINITGPAERAVWSRISAEDEGCTTETCIRRMGGICPYYRSRQAAQHAHVIIVNHALLLADVATGNRVLPDYDYLIVDEAHHLESATTNALSFRVTQPETQRIFRELGGKNAGILGRVLVVSQELLNPGQLAALNQLVESMTDKAFQFQNLLKRFFTTLDHFLVEQRDGRQLGPYSHQERILESTRTQPAWLEVEIAWEEAHHTLIPLMQYSEQIGQALTDLSESGEEEIEDLLNNLGNVYRRLSEINDNVNALVFEPSPETIYWVEIKPQRKEVILQAAPLHIGHLMEKYLWHEKMSVILTSATLTTSGEFDYLRSRLSAYDADELSVGSPFDYEEAAQIFIPDNIPEPAEREAYQRAVERSLIDLCKATGGRALVLFTSYAQLQRTSKRIGPALAEQGIQIYEQGQGASPHTLLENFKNAESAVLLGTSAFWEGVDVPGEALSVLVIVKLPFAVPSDPIVAARSETFEQPFYEYSIPEAILRFRQGFGRLIRTQHDRGIVAILDRRVLSKQYGPMFIDSLPRCTLHTGRLEELPRAATQWLGI